MGSPKSNTGIFSWSGAIADAIGGDVGKAIGAASSFVTGEALLRAGASAGETIAQGYESGGVTGALLGIPAAGASSALIAAGNNYLSDEDKRNIKYGALDAASLGGLLNPALGAGALESDYQNQQAAARAEREANTPIWLRNMFNSLYSNMNTNYDEVNSLSNYIRFQYANNPANALGSNFIGV